MFASIDLAMRAARSARPIPLCVSVTGSGKMVVRTIVFCRVFHHKVLGKQEQEVS
jgi:hypothetical protein